MPNRKMSTISNRKSIEDIIALTPLQSGMLFHYLKESQSALYHELLFLELSGPLDRELFEKAWHHVTGTNEMLRTVFRWEGLETPVQLILKEFKPVPEYYRLPGATVTPGQDSDTKYRHAVSVEEIKQKELEKGFLLSDVPFRVTLCKIEEEKYGLLVCNHHILYDGWSNGIILKEFFEAYNVLSAGNLLPKKIKSRFKEFVKWIQRRDLNKQEQYWKNYLNGVDFPTELPVKAPPDSKGTGNRFSKCYHLELSSEINAGFDDFIKEQRVTLAALMYCAWGILLQKYADSEDVVLGTTVSGRTAKIKGIENNVGLFINTLPLRVKNRAKEPVSALLSAVNQDLQEREAFENSPLVEIMQCSGLAAGVELFDSLMVIENYPLDTAALSGDFQVKSYSTVEMTNYDLTVAITRREQLEVDLNYRGDVLEQETVKRIASHFSNILKEITGSPGKNAREIELLSQEEKNEILRDFNDTAFDIGSGTTITGLFEHQVEKTPEAISIIGPGGLQGALTYRELDNLAAELALILQEKGVGPEQIAALMVDDPLETAVGILGILKAGAAYLPIDPAYPEERIRYMAADSAAKLLLKGKSIAVDIPGLAMWNLSIADFKNSPAKGKQSIREFSERELSKKGQASKRANKTNTSVNKSDRNLAGYVIYTSGTTGRPRGVLVEHGSAVNTLVYRKQAYGLDGAATLLQLFSFAFDGFVTSFFTPLISGSRLVMPGRDQLKEIFRLVDAIIEYGVTHMLCVPPLFGSILQHMPVGGAKTLRVVTLAGDKASIELVEAARAKNENLEIVNEYGITEAAVMSTICRHQEKKETITIGKPTGNTTIRIIGHHRALQPVGVPGELCIAGAGLARGYLNNPQLTAEKFAPNPHPSPSFPNNHYPVTNNSLYHTGDLARWLPGGYIEFLGRRDHQVKIRGFRIETAEIESQLLSVDGIKEAVVTCRKDGAGEAFLCAYVVKETKAVDKENIKALLASQLPSYMVPTALISLPALPLTPNGKIDRKGLPDPEFAGGTAFVAPRDVLEQRLVAIWSRVLSVDEEKIGIDDDFFRLGGHSLKATTCSLKIHKVLNVKIPVDTFFKNPTVRKLAAQVREAKQELYVSIDESEKREYYPLSASQRRLYITQHMEVEGVGYNIRALVRLQGELSLNKTGEICKGLIERHESLRTSFVMIEDKPVQRVHKAEDVLFAVEYFDAGDLGDFRVKGQAPREMDIILRDFERPFDLAMAPLFRAGLIAAGPGCFILMLEMHHIIADCTSMNLFLRDFKALYSEEEPVPLRLQYRDFSQWQKKRNREAQVALARQEAFWLETLSGELPALNLPCDFPRPAVQQFEGSVISFGIGKEETEVLREIAAAENATLSMATLALFNVLLSKTCDQEDILLGIPVAGRRHLDLEEVFGFFLNMLILRNRPLSHKTFKEFLRDVKENTVKAYSNQDYPFEELVDKVRRQTHREPGRNPVFDVVFVWQSLESKWGYIPGKEKESSGLKVTPCYFGNEKAPYDMVFTGVEAENKIDFYINFSTSLFKKETVEKLAEDFTAVLRDILKDREVTLQNISISLDLLTTASTGFEADDGDFGF